MDQPEELEFAWLMVIGILLTFILSLSVVVFFVLYQRKLHAQHLRMAHVKQEERQKRLEAVIDMQEHERDRIAKDLHDELGVLLSTTKLYLTYDEPQGEHAQHLVKATHLLDEAIDKLRTIARNLSSDHLAKFGLERSILDMVNQVEVVTDIDIQFNCQPNLKQQFTVELQLFRIVCELLNNTLKHAKASAIHIDLMAVEHVLHLNFRDDGCGFNSDAKAEGNGLGLQTLSGRVQLLDGKMNVQSEVGNGTQISITLPTNITTASHEYKHS